VNTQDLGQDRERARKAAAGDDNAWREIYEESCQPLFHFLCFQVGDREAAKDLLQETYLTAAQFLDRYRGEGSLLSWLRTIALRKSLDWKRSLWRRLRKLAAIRAESRDHTAGPDEARLEVQSQAFQQALNRLSAQQRAALLLRELEDLSFAEVARALECGEATARVHYHRGKEKMKRMLVELGASALAGEMGGQRA